VKDGRFRLLIPENGGRTVKWDLAPVELDSIVFVVEGASISASAIKLANKYGIDLVFMDKNKPMARLLPAKYGSTMRTWLHQLKAHENSAERAEIARLFVEGKTHNQRMVLMEYSRRARASGRPNPTLEDAVRRIEAHMRKLRSASTAEEAANIEAQVARIYWGAVATLIPDELEFRGRITRGKSPQKPTDPFNTALNIGYAALRREVWRAIFLAGLNPYLGFLHKPRAGKMALVFDLMEEFRPLSVDRPLISLAKNKTQVLRKFRLGREREAVVEIWRTVINYMYGAKPPHPNLIVKQARLLAMHLRGTATYKPHKSRW